MTNENLQALIGKIEPNRQPIAQGLISELEFMQKVLTDLKLAIKEIGVVDIVNGVAKESAAIKSYNQTVKSFCNCLKQLEILLRKEGVEVKEKNELEEFLAGRK